MSDQRILMGDEPLQRPPLPEAPDFGWYLLGWIGLVFTIVGVADQLLTWFPTNFGSPEWEFGTVTASLDGLPVPTLGLALLLGVGAARGQRWLMRTIAIAFTLIAFSILATAVLYATTVPIALQAVEQPIILTGLKKAIAKTTIQAVAYPLAFLWIAIKAWRHCRKEWA